MRNKKKEKHERMREREMIKIKRGSYKVYDWEG